MAAYFEKINPKLLTLGIIGFTGESGKALSKEVLKNDIFKSTTLIGRRKVEFQEEFYKNATQAVIDYDNLDNYEEVFKQDVIYCCLGTTRGKSGVEGFRKVDYDYIVGVAKLAKKSGCKEFHLVSSAGANKDSSLLYPKTKGEAEDVISKLDFEKFAAYRPKMLVADRVEKRTFERLALFLIKPIQYLAPRLLTTPIDTLAKSIIANTIFKFQPTPPKIEIIDNDKIFEYASVYDKETPK